MKCLRCGHCCIKYAVVIVDDPELGPVDGNLIARTGLDGPCQHLRGDKPGEYSCAIHHYDWFPDTPCGQFTQMETHPDTPCRMGEYLLAQETDHANL